MTYSELKQSPLGKQSTSPEEIAVWFDLHGMNNAKHIKMMMNVVERNYHTSIDWYHVGTQNVSNKFAGVFHRAFEERPSSVILRNLFIFMFKTIEMKEKDIDQLIKFSKKKIDALKSKRKKILKRNGNLHCISTMSSSRLTSSTAVSRLEDLLEVYGEINDRLCSLRQHAG